MVWQHTSIPPAVAVAEINPRRGLGHHGSALLDLRDRVVRLLGARLVEALGRSIRNVGLCRSGRSLSQLLCRSDSWAIDESTAGLGDGCA